MVFIKRFISLSSQNLQSRKRKSEILKKDDYLKEILWRVWIMGAEGIVHECNGNSSKYENFRSCFVKGLESTVVTVTQLK